MNAWIGWLSLLYDLGCTFFTGTLRFLEQIALPQGLQQIIMILPMAIFGWFCFLVLSHYECTCFLLRSHWPVYLNNSSSLCELLPDYHLCLMVWICNKDHLHLPPSSWCSLNYAHKYLSEDCIQNKWIHKIGCTGRSAVYKLLNNEGDCTE